MNAHRRSKAQMKHDGFPFIDDLHLRRESDISLWLGYGKNEIASSEKLLLKIIRRHSQ